MRVPRTRVAYVHALDLDITALTTDKIPLYLLDRSLVGPGVLQDERSGKRKILFLPGIELFQQRREI
jgi:hypothetical protein